MDQPTLENAINVDVKVINVDDLPALAADLASDAYLPACDTETEYREALEVDGIPGQVRVISLAVKREDGSEQAYVIDLRDTPAEAVNEVLSKYEFLGWNANFDEHALLLSGIRAKAWYDVMLADSVTRSGRTGVMWYRSLAAVTKLALGVDLDGKGTTQTSYDLTSDLTDEQVRYAGYDAVVTRRVAEWVRTNVDAAGLSEAAMLENRARPFINAMMINGVPFDLDGYLEKEISEKRELIASLLADIAEMTEAQTLEEAPQVALFEHAAAAGDGDGDARMVPAWNPNSKPDLVDALNKYAEEAVRKYTKKVFGEDRLLNAAETLRKDDLKQIKDPLVTKILALKAAAKEVTTYGADLRKYHRNGRFFSRYKQGGLVSTGRLASFNFNAQNLSKGMMPWMKPDQPGRVFVYGDISQAELRFGAHLSNEEDMIAAFKSGEDFHTETVKVMNPGVDVAALAETDPALMKKLRTSAKAVNFGVAYGMSANLLAKNLTVSGVDTTKDEAQGFLDAYFAGRPSLAKWLNDRDNYVANVARSLPEMDWQRSFQLLVLFEQTEIKRRALKKKLGRVPTSFELAAHVWPHGPEGLDEDDEMSDEELNEFWQSKASSLDWAYSFDGPVLLTSTGAPFEFYSYTVSGRRRIFDIPMGAARGDKFSGFLTSAVLEMAATRKPAGRQYITDFCAEHGVSLPSEAEWRSNRMGARVATVKAFEGRGAKELKIEFLRGAVKRFGWGPLDNILRRAASGCVRAVRNAYRNQPIQGSVADVVEHAFGTMMDNLPESAKPIISVHDSLTIECDEADADFVARLLRDSVMGAMAVYCSSCPAKVDVDVRSSLSDDDVIYELSDDMADTPV